VRRLEEETRSSGRPRTSSRGNSTPDAADHGVHRRASGPGSLGRVDLPSPARAGCQVAARTYREWRSPSPPVAARTVTDARVMNAILDACLDECGRPTPENLYGRRKMTAHSRFMGAPNAPRASWCHRGGYSLSGATRWVGDTEVELPGDFPPEFDISEGSRWALARGVAAAITANVFSECDAAAVPDPELRWDQLQAWLESRLAGSGAPDYTTDAPAELQQAWSTGYRVAADLDEREQASWAAELIETRTELYCHVP
jgi:hypothetical protein